MKLKKKQSYFLLLIIAVALSQIVFARNINGVSLIAGSVLCLATLLLAYFEGKFGMIVAVAMNGSGFIISIVMYNQTQDMVQLVVASFQFGVGLACWIIGRLMIRQNADHKQLEVIASIDSTTNTFTMNCFHEMYNQFINSSDNNAKLGFIIVEVDDFDSINRKFGYALSEAILKKVTSGVKESVIDDVKIYRLGISQLLVMYSINDLNILLDQGEAFKDKIIDLNNQLDEENTINISVSIGIGTYPGTSEDVRDLLSDTYSALRYSKNKGKNNVKVYTNVFGDIEDLVKTDRELEIALKMILLTVKYKDRYTYDHSIRVADYMYDFSIKLGLDQITAEKYKIAALVHDVGKINIPMVVLNKENRLDESEYEMIKNHTKLGSDLLSYLPTASEYGDVVLFHHERYDGTGYPIGLSGDNIPFGARMLTIVDSFDAMISQRPYQSIRNIPKAIAELERCSGRQFDPELTSAFVNLLNNKEINLTNKSSDISMNYPKEIIRIFEDVNQEDGHGVCEFHDNCAIYNGRLIFKKGVGSIYVNNYCVKDYISCARYKVSKTVGREYVTDYLMPNMNYKAEEIIMNVKKNDD